MRTKRDGWPKYVLVSASPHMPPMIAVGHSIKGGGRIKHEWEQPPFQHGRSYRAEIVDQRDFAQSYAIPDDGSGPRGDWPRGKSRVGGVGRAY